MKQCNNNEWNNNKFIAFWFNIKKNGRIEETVATPSYSTKGRRQGNLVIQLQRNLILFFDANRFTEEKRISIDTFY